MSVAQALLIEGVILILSGGVSLIIGIKTNNGPLGVLGIPLLILGIGLIVIMGTSLVCSGHFA